VCGRRVSCSLLSNHNFDVVDDDVALLLVSGRPKL